MADSEPVLISGGQVFDGEHEELTRRDVLVADGRIRLVTGAGDAVPDDVLRIDADGRVVMPGLIDAHWHMVFAPNAMSNLEAADTGLMYAHAVAEAQATLMRGFTTVRDTGGPTFGLKTAIDSGVIAGPRVYPSGALISQTAGHGDFAPAYAAAPQFGGSRSRFEEIGAFYVADGPEAVYAAVRTQLRKGASQIKLALGGGVISTSDPIDVLQYTEEEIRVGVRLAADWGTYVCAHVYTVEGVQRAVAAGVKSIEHGHMVDEATLALMAEHDVWLSLQPFQAGDNPLSPEQVKKAEPTSHWDRVAAWAKAEGVRVAFGTDVLFQPGMTGIQSQMLTRLEKVFGAAGALRIATSQNGSLLALSGRRNPYGDAPLGVIRDGAWADVLVVDGNPLEDISLIGRPDSSLAVIMKDGVLQRNRLS